MKAIVLLSGGLDSTVALHWAKVRGDVLAAVTVNYNQRHWVEIAQAARIAREAGVRHEHEQLGARGLGLSALSSSSGAIDTAAAAVVPCRNLAMLTIAATWLDKLGADSLVVGFCMADALDFPDCRPAFVRAAGAAISLSLGRKVLVHAPLVTKSKVQTLEMARALGCWDALGKTWTCYTPEKAAERTGIVRPCGKCPACTVRARAFADFGEPDPAAGKVVRA